MALVFKVLNGELKDKVFPITAGAIIGRSKGEIRLNDKKTSNEHAQIVYRDKNWFLEDLNSSNGLYLGATKVDEVLLTPGETITVGKTLLRVVEVGEELLEDNWLTKLRVWFADKSLGYKPPYTNVQAFTPSLKLSFIEGPQLHDVFVLGYGPRKVGSEVLDVTLADATCPALAFEIHPESNQARFFTALPDQVFLNNKRVSSELLKEGDEIRIGDNLIQISFDL